MLCMLSLLPEWTIPFLRDDLVLRPSFLLEDLSEIVAIGAFLSHCPRYRSRINVLFLKRCQCFAHFSISRRGSIGKSNREAKMRALKFTRQCASLSLICLEVIVCLTIDKQFVVGSE